MTLRAEAVGASLGWVQNNIVTARSLLAAGEAGESAALERRAKLLKDAVVAATTGADAQVTAEIDATLAESTQRIQGILAQEYLTDKQKAEVQPADFLETSPNAVKISEEEYWKFAEVWLWNGAKVFESSRSLKILQYA